MALQHRPAAVALSVGQRRCWDQL